MSQRVVEYVILQNKNNAVYINGRTRACARQKVDIDAPRDNSSLGDGKSEG